MKYKFEYLDNLIKKSLFILIFILFNKTINQQYINNKS